MMAWKILVSAPYMQPVIEEYRGLLEDAGVPAVLVIPPVQERLSSGGAVGACERADVVREDSERVDVDRVIVARSLVPGDRGAEGQRQRCCEVEPE